MKIRFEICCLWKILFEIINNWKNIIKWIWIIKYKRFIYRNYIGKYLMEDVDIFDVVFNKRYVEF